jgi:hypothetical protein
MYWESTENWSEKFDRERSEFGTAADVDAEEDERVVEGQISY